MKVQIGWERATDQTPTPMPRSPPRYAQALGQSKRQSSELPIGQIPATLRRMSEKMKGNGLDLDTEYIMPKLLTF